MIRLNSFGTIDLRGETGELRGILAQPKRLALLLRLAAERPGSFLRRDTLLAMFWPELDAAGARNALRQALFHLRRELGDGVLVNRGDDEVGLDPGRIGSDIADFEQAAAAGRWADALALVRGEFAPGLYLSEAQGFEDWLESTRHEIRRRAAHGGWQLAREAESRGALAEAVGWARRALEQAPDDEAGFRGLLRLLIAAGDSAGAARAYAAFEERLRRDYGVAPAPETLALRRSVPSDTPAGIPPGPPVPESRPPTPVKAPGLPTVPRKRIFRHTVPIAFLVVMASAVLVGLWRSSPAGDLSLADDRLLIAPFRVDARDSVLERLSTGLVDLVSVRLSGSAAPHPVDADVGLRTLASLRVPDDAPAAERLRLAAERTGAGLVLSGSLMIENRRLLIAPWLLEPKSGRITQLPEVAGPLDSLPWMVDQLAATVMSRFAGDAGVDAPALAATPLPALRAYLDGRAAMRDGRVEDAVVALGRALELDSTFALAARDFAEAADWVGEDPGGVAKARAWSLRDRLGVRDRALLVAFTGRRWPAATPVREQVEDWEAAVRWTPDRAQTWFGLGDVLFHMGNVVGIPAAQDRARNAFDRALALDSASVPVLLHRIEMAAREGDTGMMRRLGSRARDSDASGDAMEFIRWRAATALGDSAALRGRAGSLDSMATFALIRVAGWSQLDGLAIGGPARAARILQRRARTSAEVRMALTVGIALAGNRGRFAEMDSLLHSYGQSAVPTLLLLFAGEDAARPLLPALERAVNSGADTTASSRNEVVFWHLWTGDTIPVVAASRFLAEADRHPGDLVQSAFGCLAAVRLRVPSAAAHLRRADSLLVQVPGADLVGPAVLLIARCHEVAGDRPGALALLARGPLDPVYGTRFLAGMLYDEGRLAILEGDRPRALRAWRHLLSLRDDPDPALRGQVVMLRRAVDSLSRP